jgi:peptidyl-prolyl cis-trans isomerase C
MSPMIRRWLSATLREPIIHFLIAGAGIFIVYSWFGGAIGAESRSITLTEGQVQRLAEGWAQSWQRAPTDQELDGLIRDAVKEEIYAREAARLGLDQDDAVIRRRLRSKMEFLAASAVESDTPSEPALQKWMDAHPGRYPKTQIYSFDQIYAGADAHRAKGLLARLKSTQGSAFAGETLSVPPSMNKVPAAEIARVFGDNFAASIAGLPLGSWTGPVASGFGFHLVRVREATAQRRITIADIRKKVENDWRAATREEREEKAYQTLLDAYTIRIERPR